MKKGYDVFGKAYGVMLRNDLHAVSSIDHQLLQEMILLDEESQSFLYGTSPQRISMDGHELFPFAQQFRGMSSLETIRKVLAYTNGIAVSFEDVPFETSYFGGTEKEILKRGTDWCADIARVSAVLLDCLGIPARIVYLANTSKAYNGHVVIEAFYEGKYGLCDPIYGYCFYRNGPVDAYTLLRNPSYLQGYEADYAGLYTAAAISPYNPMNPENKYEVSMPNQYYLTLIGTNHNAQWMMGEDQ